MAEPEAVPLKKRIVRAGGGCALSWLAWFVRILPATRADAFGKWVGRLMFRASKKYRNRAIANLKMCYPDWTDEKVKETALKVFEHFAKTTVRFFRTDKLNIDQIRASVEFEGVEAFNKALERGKGVIFISAHFGNWEIMGYILSAAGLKLSAVARDADQERTTELVNATRNKAGIEVFSRGKAAREFLRRLEKNEVVVILPDQNTRELLVPFFGKPAGTNEGPALIQLRTGAAIVLAFCWEKPDGNYQALAYELELPRPTGDKTEDAKQIMARINNEIEKKVREHPEQWLWMHDRWRYARELGLLN